jgi:eukaryotic-like serine/threonine-protein kinase
MSLEVGTRIGDYEIVAILGAGGMGKVFKVRNVISDRIEAMKVLLPDLEHEPDLADRFMREIKVQASLQHPNIATLHTALRVDNQLLMLMEFVEGVTLDQRLQQGPIPLANAVDYIAQVLNALSYAHEHGVIHRDIKPANMMLTSNGTVKLMDFGIAKATTDRRLTITGTTMGSLYYMSPEQIKGMATTDARSDLYSVGVSLYEITTGKKPFDGDSQFAIMAAHLEKTPVAPITLDDKLPQGLNDVILMAIAKEPDQRFQSAKAFAGALGSVRQSLGMPVPVASSGNTATMPLASPPAPAMASPPAMGAPAAPPQAPGKSSKRWLWVGAGALATALALVAVIQFGPWRKNSAQAEQQASPPAAPANTATTPAQPPPVTTPPPEQQAVTPPAAEPAPVAAPATPPVTLPASSTAKRPARQVARQGTAPAARPQNTPATPVANEAPQPASGPDPAAVLQEFRERLVQLDARAGSVRTSLGNLKRSQEASGMSLRGDMAAAETRMNYLMDGANSALRAHDPAAAKKFLDSADTEVEKLEKFLGL